MSRGSLQHQPECEGTSPPGSATRGPRSAGQEGVLLPIGVARRPFSLLTLWTLRAQPKPSRASDRAQLKTIQVALSFCSPSIGQNKQNNLRGDAPICSARHLTRVPLRKGRTVHGTPDVSSLLPWAQFPELGRQGSSSSPNRETIFG